MLSTISCPPLAPSPLKDAATAIEIGLLSARELCGNKLLNNKLRDNTIDMVINAREQNLATVLRMKLQSSYKNYLVILVLRDDIRQ
jgi:hypothetical protein